MAVFAPAPPAAQSVQSCSVDTTAALATELGARPGEGRAGVATLGAPGEPVNSVHVRSRAAGDGGRGRGFRAAGTGVRPAPPFQPVLTHAPSARPQTAGRTRLFFFFFLVKLWPRELPPIHFCANHEARTDPERGHGTPPAGLFITRGA